MSDQTIAEATPEEVVQIETTVGGEDLLVLAARDALAIVKA